MDAIWPVLALDGSGNPIVAWSESTAGYGSPHLGLVRRWNNGWEKPIVLNRNASYDAIWPSVATDSSGWSYVVYIETQPIAGAISKLFMTRITWNEGSDAKVEPPSILDSAGDSFVLATTSYARLSLAVSQNIAHVAYVKASPAAMDVLRCTEIGNVSFAPSCVSTGGSLTNGASWTAGSPSIVLDGSGNPTVAWDGWNVARTVSTFTVETWSGGTWTLMPGSPMTIEPLKNAHVPQLAFNGDLLVAVWREQAATGGAASIYLKRYNQ
jgi:hypothetical protein